MRFESPLALIALVLVPAAVGGYLALHRRRGRDAARFATPALLPNMVAAAPAWRRHVPPAVLLGAVTLLLVGFARPHATIPVRSEEATAVLLIDNSRSMGATDVEPTRLAAAQALARQFLSELPDKYRLGVVAFSSRAQVVAAPTRDRLFVEDALDALRLGEATAIGDAIATAVRLTRGKARARDASGESEAPPAVILLISDGTEDGGRVAPAVAIRQARAAHVPVFTALVGTELGVVEVRHIGGFVERIQVPPDPDLLERVAGQTGGRFFEAPAEEDLKAVHADLRSRLATSSKDTEITVAFAAGAAVLLLAASGLAVLWFRRAL
jgi:Ca-activated chloride channel family protein